MATTAATTTTTRLFHALTTALNPPDDIVAAVPTAGVSGFSVSPSAMTTTAAAAALPSVMPRPIPPDYLLQTQFVCNRVLIPLVVSVGIIGNLLSLVVLTRKEMASPTNCFLTALAISDISLLLLHLPTLFGLNASLAATAGFELFSRYYKVILYVMSNVFITCTCWLTVAVTVERFFSLRFMMHPRLVFSLMRAKRVILAIFFASFLFHFSKFFEYVPNTDLRSPRPLLPTELSLNKAYDTAMHVANITLAALLPIAALVVFNSFLIYFLATHRRRMLRHKSGSQASGLGLGKGGAGASNGGGGGGGGVGGGGGGGGGCVGSTSVDMLHVSSVVVAVVLVFVVCHSLGVFVALNIAVRGRLHIFSNPLFIAFKHVNGLLVTLNSSVNFLVYCSISRKFRAMFAAIFLHRWGLAGACGTSATGPVGGKSAGNKGWSGAGCAGAAAPVPLGDQSMATALTLRAKHHHANGYTRGASSSNDCLADSGVSGGAREASFVLPSPTNSSAAASVDQLDV